MITRASKISEQSRSGFDAYELHRHREMMQRNPSYDFSQSPYAVDPKYAGMTIEERLNAYEQEDIAAGHLRYYPDDY